MTRKVLSLAALLAVITIGISSAAFADGKTEKASVNKTCPMTGEANGKGSVTVEHRGKTITLCCKMCRGTWKKMTEAQRDDKLAKSSKGKSESMTGAAAYKGEAYPFATCALSGRPLDVKGTQTIKQFEGREVRTCCKGCMAAYAKNRSKYDAKLDKKIVEDQLKFYSLTTCPISGSKLGGMGEPVNMVVGNRLVRICCAGCKKKVAADPAKYVAMVDGAAAKAQGASYALDTCVVSGNKLGSMGSSPEIVVSGRLVRLCCKGCIGKVKQNPAAYIAKLDAAGKGTAKSTPEKKTEDHGHDHDH